MPSNEQRKQADFLREQAIFLAAVEAGPEQRKAILDDKCGGDAALRQRVEALLAAHDAEGSLPPMAPPLDETQALEAAAGAMIAGKYKLLEEIGHGGMGVVWMAEQRTPVRRLVAVKLIRAGMDSRSVIARFEAERQALAMMDHPNIARVFDGGITEQGRPYFAMELVRGLPVTQYCDQRRMTVRDRLLLFTQVCHAVQHAHQKGIIHRDIKPTNVLVTEHDGQPVPKVIDFGLAKAIGGTGVLTEHTVFTGFGQIAGTPLYTAPEQVAINSIDVDTRVDVYALGVLLYELLTGSTPLDRERLKQAAWDEVCRVIREEEPPRPSTRVSTSALLPNLAASRHTEPAKLCGLIKGDLDWIVLKALDKERRLRYDTATALVADIERHLNDEPVVAAPPSVAYLTRKFVRKHNKAVVTAATVAALLAIGLATTTWQWRRADANAKRAIQNQQVAEARKTEADRQRDAAELEAYIGNMALAITAMGNCDWREARCRLNACPTSKRAFEWQFLNQRAQSAAYGFPKQFTRFVVSPDGEHVLTMADYGAESATQPCVVWDADGKRVSEITPDGTCWEAAFSPDGTLLLTRSLDTVRLWDIHGKSIGSPIVQGTKDGCWYASFGADSKSVLIVVIGRSPHVTARLWSHAGKPISPVIAAEGGSCFKSLSPDGESFLVQEYKNNTVSISIRNLSGKAVGSPMALGPVNKLAPESGSSAVFSPDGKMILTSYCRDVRLWTVGGLPIGKPMPGAGVGTFAPNGQSVLAWCDESDNGYTARFYDLTGSPVGEQMKEVYGSWSHIFSRDGRLLLAWSGEGIAQWWNLTGKRAGEPILLDSIPGDPNMTPFGRPMCNLMLTRDGRHMIVVGEHDVHLRDLNGQIEGQESPYWQTPLDSPSHYSDKTRGDSSCYFKANIDTVGDVVIAAFCDGNGYTHIPIVAWRMNHFDSPVATFLADQHPDEEIAARTADAGVAPRAAISVTQALTRSVLATNNTSYPKAADSGRDHAITAMVVSPDGQRIVSAEGASVRFRDAASSRELAIIPVPSEITDLRFSKDGTRLILKFSDGRAELWDARGFEERAKDRKARSRESQPAREYVKRLLSQPAETRDWLQAIRNNATITPLRKLVAIEIADAEIGRIDGTAKTMLGSLIADQLSKSRVVAAVKKEPDLVMRMRMLHLVDSNKDWLCTATDALWKIVDRDDQPKKRYQAAAEAADELVAMKPESTPSVADKSYILRTIAAAYYHVGRYEDAIRLYNRAVAISTEGDPSNRVVSLCRIAIAQFKLGQVNEARETLKGAAVAAEDITTELPNVFATARKLINSPTARPTEGSAAKPNAP
jgi:serine/threonine protein kinase/WD40 repeat protein